MHQSIQFTTDETLTLAKAKACNLIGSWTESISSQGLEYFFPNVEIHSSYSQTLSSGPDFEANGIKIEAEHRASGYTREKDFEREVVRKLPTGGLYIFFNGYSAPQLNEIYAWSNRNNIITISLPAIPYIRSGDIFIFERSKLDAHRAECLSILRDKLAFYLPKISPNMKIPYNASVINTIDSSSKTMFNVQKQIDSNTHSAILRVTEKENETSTYDTGKSRFWLISESERKKRERNAWYDEHSKHEWPILNLRGKPNHLRLNGQSESAQINSSLIRKELPEGPGLAQDINMQGPSIEREEFQAIQKSICQFCGREFEPLRSDSKYCSTNHRVQAYQRRKFPNMRNRRGRPSIG